VSATLFIVLIVPFTANLVRWLHSGARGKGGRL
jgi:hypothetical protein